MTLKASGSKHDESHHNIIRKYRNGWNPKLQLSSRAGLRLLLFAFFLISRLGSCSEQSVEQMFFSTDIRTSELSQETGWLGTAPRHEWPRPLAKKGTTGGDIFGWGFGDVLVLLIFQEGGVLLGFIGRHAILVWKPCGIEGGF